MATQEKIDKSIVGKSLTEKELCKRFHLDDEIRELLLFAFDQYGDDGIRYVVSEIGTIIAGLDAGKLTAEKQ